MSHITEKWRGMRYRPAKRRNIQYVNCSMGEDEETGEEILVDVGYHVSPAEPEVGINCAQVEIESIVRCSDSVELFGTLSVADMEWLTEKVANEDCEGW